MRKLIIEAVPFYISFSNHDLDVQVTTSAIE